MPSRRRLLKMLAGSRCGGCRRLGPAARYARQRLLSRPVIGPLRRHALLQSGGAAQRDLGAFLKWQFSDRGAAWPTNYPSPFRDRPPARHEGDGARIAYVGHASFLIQTRGRNLLIDPVWADQVGPLSFIGPRRANPPGIAFEDLPRIDAVLVTHNHYDHMDTQRRSARAVATLPAAHHYAARQRYDPVARGAGPDGNGRGLGRQGRSRRRPDRARGADRALVGARHRRPHARAMGELRPGGRGKQDLLHRRYRLWQRRHFPPRARAPSRAGAGADADRRLRAALVHAQQPHQPRRRRCRCCSCPAPRVRSAITGARSTSPTRRSSSPCSTWLSPATHAALRRSASRRLRPGEVHTIA